MYGRLLGNHGERSSEQPTDNATHQADFLLGFLRLVYNTLK